MAGFTNLELTIDDLIKIDKNSLIDFLECKYAEN